MSYQCSQCSYVTAKWVGFCPQCKERGSIREVTEAAVQAAVAGGLQTVAIDDVGGDNGSRRSVGIAEVDHVLGGGLVDGAVILVGGEPGVGKSTLLLQIAAAVGGGDGRALIATGEESVDQIGLRAKRIGVAGTRVDVAAGREAAAVAGAIAGGGYSLVIVDSIQTMVCADVDGYAGGVAQLRESSARLIAAAKDAGTPVVFVGHVTKDGSLAGPKVIEHMVDVVVHLDGSDLDSLRFLRCLKNRFGSTDRVGIFEMTDRGLREVPDPVGCLVTGWGGRAEGTVLFPSVQGKRPLLVEVQALVTPSRAPQPRRSFKGLEAARVHQILAVLEKHAGLSFSDHEVYVSLAGGARITEPASDLPVALALASSRGGRPLGSLAAWGEVGLTGEVRAVGRSRARLEEVERLGVTRIVSPESSGTALMAALAHAGLFETNGRPKHLSPV